MDLTVAGWKEWVTFPDLGEVALRGKLDTGADRSALHVGTHKVVKAASGEQMVQFTLSALRPGGTRRSRLRVRLPLVGRAVVRRSSGDAERRPVVQLAMRLGDETRQVRVTLTDRAHMKIALLLGRDALRDRFLVDPGHTYLLGRRGEDPARGEP